MQGFHFWQFMAGIAVFVYAMSLIESSLRNLAGRSFKKFLQKQSKNKVKMVLSSTIVTAFLQSSSIVLLMVLSFVGAGLLELRGALAAVLGSNLGTTFVNWVIALVGFKINFHSVSYIILGLALFGLLLFKKNTRAHHMVLFFIGFAFIFISLEWLKESVDKSIGMQFQQLGHFHYLAFIPIGFLVTAIIQSSSATVAIALTALHYQIFPIENAAAFVIGSELGTTLKFMIGSVGAVSDKKRIALGNFTLNIITTLIAIFLMFPILNGIQDYFGIYDAMIQLVVFQTTINLLSIILLFPFLGILARFLQRFYKEDLQDRLTHFIRKTETPLPGDALELAERETLHLLNETIELNKKILGVDSEKANGWISSIRNFTSDTSSAAHQYFNLKLLYGEILEYISEIPKSDMSESEVEQTGTLINIIRHILRSAKNVKDIQHNLDEFESSANDHLHQAFIEVQANEKIFYSSFQELLKPGTGISSNQADELMHQNRTEYDTAISQMLVLLKEDKIRELDSTNLINVYRELYSSKKALIRALADIKGLEIEEL